MSTKKLNIFISNSSRFHQETVRGYKQSQLYASWVTINAKFKNVLKYD